MNHQATNSIIQQSGSHLKELSSSVAILPVRSSLANRKNSIKPKHQSTSVADVTRIVSMDLILNDQLVQLAKANNRLGGNDCLAVCVDDSLQVSNVKFNSNYDGGVFAAEGFMSRLGSEPQSQVMDFNDGRFSLVDDKFSLDGNIGTIDGLIGSWTVRPEWTELNLNLIHYSAEATKIAATVKIQLAIQA